MASIHSLFAQLQARYPTSCLVTELVQCRENLFVVRASIQIGGTTIATGMAANLVLETAEDQARLRSLNVLGIGFSATSPTLEPINGFSHPMPTSQPLTSPSWLEPVSPLPLENPSTLESANPVASIEPNFSGNAALGTTTPDILAVDLTSAEYSNTFDSGVETIQDSPLNDYLPEESYSPEDDYTPEVSYSELEALDPVVEVKPKSSNSKPQKAAKSPETAISPPVEEPNDLSNLIALTDIEMDRVGWTKQQGREYLKSTYSKSTRQRLDLDELMDFLNYLRALPSANGL